MKLNWKRNKAKIILSMGRFHLLINGFVVASETDLCRDYDLCKKFKRDYWTKDMMQAIIDP